MPDLVNDGKPFLGCRASQLGLTSYELRLLLRDHVVRRVLRGVYVDAAVPDTRELRSAALHLVMPPYGVLYGCTASWALSVDTFQPRDRFTLMPECVVPHGATRCTANGVRCVEGYLPPEDIIEIDGLRLTTPVRTGADLLRTLRRPYALSGADGLAHADLVDVQELRRYLARLRGYPGIVQARELSMLIEPRAESAGESWQRLRLIDAGFPRPEPQYVVVDSRDREVARLDLAYPRLRIGMEYDGLEYHSDDEDRAHDRDRRGFLTDVLRWRLVVCGKDDILGSDPAFELEVGSLLGRVPLLPRAW
jgi:hypothetical protein